MKKMLLFAAGAIVSFAALSQVSFGIHGTGNLADAKIKYSEDFDYKKKMKAMPGAGIDVQFALSKNFALRSGVNYVQNGVTLNATVDETVEMKVKIENNLHYIQVPVNLLYAVPLARVQFFAGAGGFINYGISGKSKISLAYTMPDGHESVTIEEADAFKKEEDGGANLKRTDYGISALAGLRLRNGIFVNVGYQLSLANLDNSDEGDGTYKNRGLQLTLGFFFR